MDVNPIVMIVQGMNLLFIGGIILKNTERQRLKQGFSRWDNLLRNFALIWSLVTGSWLLAES